MAVSSIVCGKVEYGVIIFNFGGRYRKNYERDGSDRNLFRSKYTVKHYTFFSFFFPGYLHVFYPKKF